MPDASTPTPSSHPLRKVIETMARHGAEYLIIGGQAESLMGSPRVTYDVDLCYRRDSENLKKLASALAELNVSLRGAPPGLPFRADAKTLEAGFNFTLESTAGALDLLGDVVPIGDFDAVAAHAENYESWGMRVRTISLDDLIRVKRFINRPKDAESLYQLLAIKQLREETGLQ